MAGPGARKPPRGPRIGRSSAVGDVREDESSCLPNSCSLSLLSVSFPPSSSRRLLLLSFFLQKRERFYRRFFLFFFLILLWFLERNIYSYRRIFVLGFINICFFSGVWQCNGEWLVNGRKRKELHIRFGMIWWIIWFDKYLFLLGCGWKVWEGRGRRIWNDTKIIMISFNLNLVTAPPTILFTDGMYRGCI